jgi:hypothetical protein
MAAINFPLEVDSRRTSSMNQADKGIEIDLETTISDLLGFLFGIPAFRPAPERFPPWFFILIY